LAACSNRNNDSDIDIRSEFWIAPFRLARTRHVACLDCGVVTGYLDDATVTKLRARRAKPIKVKAIDNAL
jgi:hypothetical protein